MKEWYLLRPVRMGDFEKVRELVEGAEEGLASMPREEKLLRENIELAVESFGREVEKLKDEYYLFVLEEVGSGRIVGTSGIHARAGGKGSYFCFKEEEDSYDMEIKEKRLRVLQAREVYHTCSELCSLYLKEEVRGRGLARLLSLGRYHFMRGESGRFAENLIAFMRGYRDEEGRSSFWEGVGRVFFEGELGELDRMKSAGKRAFLRKAMPHYPLYVDLMEKGIRESIGRADMKTQGAVELLLREGYKGGDEVDVLDGGPILTCKKEAVRTMKEILEVEYRGEEGRELKKEGIVSCGRGGEFRACVGWYDEESGRMEGKIGKVLGLKNGDRVYVSSIKGDTL